jgi:glycosyltransferase involved in cell wall biosynthesis
MKVLHVFFYMKTGGVERSITRMLPRLHNPPDLEMRLILAVAGGELLDEIEPDVPTKVLHGKDMFRQIYDEALECDVVHVHTINDMRLLLDAVAWAPASVIENIRTPIESQAPQLSDCLVPIADHISEWQSITAPIKVIPDALPVALSPSLDKFNSKTPVYLLEVARPDKKRTYRLADFYPLFNEPGLVHIDIVGSDGENKPGLTYHGLQKDTRPFFQKAHFHFNAPEFEAFGLTVLEAYRDGAIPIAQTTGGLRDLVANEKTGYLFKERMNFAEVKAMLRKIVREYLKTPGKFAQMASQGYNQLKQNYSIETCVQSYRELYKDLQRKNRPVWDQGWSPEFGAFYDLFGLKRLSPEMAVSLSSQLRDPQERAMAFLRSAQLFLPASPQKAGECLGQITEEPLDIYDFYFARHEIDYLLGNLKSAEANLCRCIEKAPERMEPYLTFADLLLQRRDVKKALDVLISFQKQNGPSQVIDSFIQKIDTNAFQ